MPCGSVLDFVSSRITKGYTLNTHTYANTQNRVSIWNIYLLILDIPPRNKFKAPYFLSSISKKTERVTNSISSTESPFSLFNNSGVSTSSPLLTLEPLFFMSLWNSLYFIQQTFIEYLLCAQNKSRTQSMSSIFRVTFLLVLVYSVNSQELTNSMVHLFKNINLYLSFIQTVFSCNNSAIVTLFCMQQE